MKKHKLLLSLLTAGIMAASSLPVLSASAAVYTPSLVTSATAAVSKPAKVTVKKDYTCASDAIRINWNKVSGASGYRIYRLKGSKWTTIATVSGGNTTNYRNSGLASGTVYKYKVKAYKKSGSQTIWGTASDTKYASTRPSKLTTKPSNISRNVIRLNWNKTTCTGYQVYQVNGSSLKKLAVIRSSDTTTYRVTGLTPGTSYTFKLRAYKDDGKGKVNVGTFVTKTLSTRSSAVSDQEIALARLVNSERAKAGLKTLALDDKLCQAANVRAKEIAEYFSHTRPDGTTCFTVLDDFSIQYWSAGENIAIGYPNSASVMSGWMGSPGHKANILTSSFTKIGVGYDPVTRAWVQIFTG